MRAKDAQALLQDAELIVCLQTSIPEAKRLLHDFLENDIPAILGADATCKTGCAPRAQLLIRKDDTERAVMHLQKQWVHLLQREGTWEPPAPRGDGTDSDEPPCPACGATGALVDGACPDCGLHLG